MAASESIRCLIADDHTIIREGLAAILRQAGDLRVVGMACNGCEALELFRLHRPHVTLMDIRMPELDGLKAMAAIHQEYPLARILIVTDFDGDDDVFHAIRAGARGFLRTDVSRDELLEAIRTVHYGQTVLDADMMTRLVRHVSADELTQREREVLGHMAQGRSNQEIALGLSIAESTVKTHVNNIFNKLGVNDRTQAVVTALHRGVVRLN